MNRILIIDDEVHLLNSISRLYTDDDIQIYEARNGKDGLKNVMEHAPEVIVVDFKMPEMDGLEFLKAVKSVRQDIPVIVMTAHGDKSTAVKFLEEGAFRYLEKPIRPDEFKLTVKEALHHFSLIRENEKLQNIVSLDNTFSEIIGASPVMKELFSMIQRVASTDISVLIQGESGTGKELIAKAIHEKSDRSGKPFIRFNCAALPESLIESELFGHEKGAFTGADHRKLGRFELAQEGTIFIDEIGELNPNIQVKLLRVLQEKEFERLGGIETIKINVRIIAATNQNLEDMMKSKLFREDLYYRLNSFPLFVPPLRTRGKDIVLLAQHFLKKFAKEYNVPATKFSEAAKEILLQYQWKGNVRELQNIISRAVILCQEEVITEALIPLSIPKKESFVLTAVQEKLTEDNLVKMYAKEVYRQCKNNKKDTAEWLDINYRTLMNRLS